MLSSDAMPAKNPAEEVPVLDHPVANTSNDIQLISLRSFLMPGSSLRLSDLHDLFTACRTSGMVPSGNHRANFGEKGTRNSSPRHKYRSRCS